MAGTSLAKSVLYEGYSNIVGFKVDMRILIDYKDEEFDLVCGETCHQDANDKKLKTDNSKLMREGKEMQRNMSHIFYRGTDLGYSWMVQVKGTKCSFSTIHATHYHYHVSVPQFKISFPGSFSVMDEENCDFIVSLLAFNSCVEKLAIDLENKLKTPLPNRSPDRSLQHPGTYFVYSSWV